MNGLPGGETDCILPSSASEASLNDDNSGDEQDASWPDFLLPPSSSLQSTNGDLASRCAESTASCNSALREGDSTEDSSARGRQVKRRLGGGISEDGESDDEEEEDQAGMAAGMPPKSFFLKEKRRSKKMRRMEVLHGETEEEARQLDLDETVPYTLGSLDPNETIPYTYAMGLPPLPSSFPSSGKSVRFHCVEVYYFPREQGFSCVPDSGEISLGMSPKHHDWQKFLLTERQMEQEEGEGEELEEGEVAGASVYSESTLPGHRCSLGYMKPLPLKIRKSKLRLAGIRIDSCMEDAAELDEIRRSRRQCGCTCKGGVCLPETCECALQGINCQVDDVGESSFPCVCARLSCQNPSGRLEYDPQRVSIHHRMTCKRLWDMERFSNGETASPLRIRFDSEGQPSTATPPPMRSEGRKECMGSEHSLATESVAVSAEAAAVSSLLPAFVMPDSSAMDNFTPERPIVHSRLPPTPYTHRHPTQPPQLDSPLSSETPSPPKASLDMQMPVPEDGTLTPSQEPEESFKTKSPNKFPISQSLL